MLGEIIQTYTREINYLISINVFKSTCTIENLLDSILGDSFLACHLSESISIDLSLTNKIRERSQKRISPLYLHILIKYVISFKKYSKQNNQRLPQFNKYSSMNYGQKSTVESLIHNEFKTPEMYY